MVRIHLVEMFERHGLGLGQGDFAVVVTVGHDDHPSAAHPAAAMHPHLAELSGLVGVLDLLAHDDALFDPLLAGLRKFFAADHAVLVGVEPVEGGRRVAHWPFVDHDTGLGAVGQFALGHPAECVHFLTGDRSVLVGIEAAEMVAHHLDDLGSGHDMVGHGPDRRGGSNRRNGRGRLSKRSGAGQGGGRRNQNGFHEKPLLSREWREAMPRFLYGA